VLILEVTSVALVVIGIAGELFVDWKSDDLQTRLRDANGSLVLKLEQSAGEAKESAKTAAKDATTAKVASAGAVADSGTALTLAKGARKEADSFEGDIKSAKTEAADAESHLAEARERAAAAETRVLELNAKLADRTLSDEQIKAIGAKLARYAGQEYDIVPYWDSPESVGIANRIQLALAAVAQWKYKPPGSWEGLMGGLVGIKVSVHPQADEATLAAAKDLTLALQNAGLEAKEELQNPKNPKSNAIGLSVGSKR
jgi:hypothetical protein